MPIANALQMQSCIVRSQAILTNVLDDETVMINLERGEYYGLNPIGSRIWRLLEKPHRVAELCAALQPDFDVAPEQCAKDVMAFLNRLAERDLIQVVAEA